MRPICPAPLGRRGSSQNEFVGLRHQSLLILWWRQTISLSLATKLFPGTVRARAPALSSLAHETIHSSRSVNTLCIVHIVYYEYDCIRTLRKKSRRLKYETKSRNSILYYCALTRLMYFEYDLKMERFNYFRSVHVLAVQAVQL